VLFTNFAYLNYHSLNLTSYKNAGSLGRFEPTVTPRGFQASALPDELTCLERLLLDAYIISVYLKMVYK